MIHADGSFPRQDPYSSTSPMPFPHQSLPIVHSSYLVPSNFETDGDLLTPAECFHYNVPIGARYVPKTSAHANQSPKPSRTSAFPVRSKSSEEAQQLKAEADRLQKQLAGIQKAKQQQSLGTESMVAEVQRLNTMITQLRQDGDQRTAEFTRYSQKRTMLPPLAALREIPSQRSAWSFMSRKGAGWRLVTDQP